jgi:hypothetical protein
MKYSKMREYHGGMRVRNLRKLYMSRLKDGEDMRRSCTYVKIRLFAKLIGQKHCSAEHQFLLAVELLHCIAAVSCCETEPSNYLMLVSDPRYFSAPTLHN